jgi:hypothetical protein
MKNGRLGDRHHCVAVLLYCVFGLASTVQAQSCTALQQAYQAIMPLCAMTSPPYCDQGEAMAHCRSWIIAKNAHEAACTGFPPANYTCNIVVESATIPNGYARAQIGAGGAHQWFWQYTCESRDPLSSGQRFTSDGAGFGCMDGCLYSEALDFDFALDHQDGTTENLAYILTPTGALCPDGDSGPQIPPDPPPADPCADTPVGEACLEPPNFCVNGNCVELPPPGGCSYGDPTLCVGNPPPPPASPPPPEPPPGDDPCATGTGTANGQNFGINVHCLEEPPCEPGTPGCETDPCDANPNLPQCEEEGGGFCEDNPEHVDCNSYCENNAQDPLCQDNFCENNPEHFLCTGNGNCGEHPDDPVCENACTQVPPPSFCPGGGNTCQTNPNDPVCRHCVLYPSDPVCQNSGNPCDEDPQSDACTGAQVGGGATCEDRPACTGDVISCAILNQQWETRCAIERLGDDGEEPEPIEGNAEDHYSDEEIGIGTFNTSGFLGGGGCPADTIVLNFFGSSEAVPMLWCDILPWLGFLVVAAATVTGVRILGS